MPSCHPLCSINTDQAAMIVASSRVQDVARANLGPRIRVG